jgi:pyruvate kinase
MKATKIITTIGPATYEYEKLKALALAGANIFRLNFSHGEYDWYRKLITTIKKLNQELDAPIAIMLDTKGPEIRTGDLTKPIKLEDGSTITLTVGPQDEAKRKISVNYDAFISDVIEGEKIPVDNGVMSFLIKKIEGKDAICEVIDGGTLKSRRHLNLPGRHVSLDSITPKDWADIEFGIEQGVDFIALSFIRTADEIKKLRAFLTERNANIQIIAKIESFEAIANLESIAATTDGIMVARGDLGAEVNFAEVPLIQKKLIRLGRKYQKPVIVATHMLESMIKNPMPTRAEVTDIAEAIWQRSDAIMLSGETAAGDHPIRAVETMVEVAKTIEPDIVKTQKCRENMFATDLRSEMARSAAHIASTRDDIAGIFVMTRSGHMARVIANFRPLVPIFAFTEDTQVRRQLQLLWGTEAHEIKFSTDAEKSVERAIKNLLAKNEAFKGKNILLLSDTFIEGQSIPTVQIRML